MFANPIEQPQTSKDSQLNKRRRFAPISLPVIVSSDGADLDHDPPLMLNMCDPSPSQQEIEAQLLQVGMRVRKAVSEGYQNTQGNRAYTPRPFFNSRRLSPETMSALSKLPSESDANFSAGGLHNVGSLAMQPLSTATFCGISLAAMSHMSSGPAIAEQKLWSYSTAHKRRQQFEDESDSDDSQEFMPRTPQLECSDAAAPIPQDYFNINFGPVTEISPMSWPQEEAPKSKASSRKMAMPKSRLRTVPETPVPAINPFAQIAPNPPARSIFGHQRMRSCGMDAMDFGEASFLQPRQDIEMDCS